ncbi:GNAT family N-acetyltransferase [Paenibacillus lycopersici]|uniref:GNAT family N-acetyltransferase n=1 Tax=Paenibacillus lycopersici TaxID=2704462 RepID=A0A6C0G0K8_9BACL|nr:GNAT family N-acetyltransferase [Paenibacillus lycopersici]QHT62397.1 GNAT family N-acetyltransferase [Paenibacillus lycopersici]
MIEIIPLDKTELVQRLLHIQHAAYRIEAELIGFDDIPGLRDTLSSLRDCGETFFGWFEGGGEGELAGAIAYRAEGRVVDIHRLVVDPAHFRKGIGEALVRHLFAAHAGCAFIVATGSANLPAKRLYRKLGFAEMRERQAAPGLWITEFERDG